MDNNLTAREHAIDKWLHRLQGSKAFSDLSTHSPSSDDAHYQSFRKRLLDLSKSAEALSTRSSPRARTPSSPKRASYLGEAFSQPLRINHPGSPTSAFATDIINRTLSPARKAEFIEDSTTPQSKAPKNQSVTPESRPISRHRMSLLQQRRRERRKEEKSRVIEDHDRNVQATPQSSKIVQKLRESRAHELTSLFDVNQTGLIGTGTLTEFINGELNYKFNLSPSDFQFISAIIQSVLIQKEDEPEELNGIVMFEDLKNAILSGLNQSNAFGYSNSIVLNSKSPEKGEERTENSPEVKENFEPFSPRTCPGTNKMVKKRLSRPKSPLLRSFELHRDHSDRQSRLQELSKKIESERLKECSFKPTISPNPSTSSITTNGESPAFARLNKSRNLLSTEEIELESKCSFKPRIVDCPEFIKEFNEKRRLERRTKKQLSRSNSPIVSRSYTPSRGRVKGVVPLVDL
ncbi:hypothetical protein P9112_007759 [Eukaryota sp. TZLM1-RC]